MYRRDVLAALAGAGLSVLTANQGRAGVGRGCFQVGLGGLRCTAGFVNTPPMPAQPCRSQCWATCLAYLMQGYGANVMADDLLDRAGQWDCPVHDPDAELSSIQTAAGSWKDRSGRAFLLGLTPLGSLHETMPVDPDFPALLDRLTRQPVMCGAAGHATVVTEITTFSSASFPFRREAVTVRDPWSPTAGLRPLSDIELAHRSWVMGVAVRPLGGS